MPDGSSANGPSSSARDTGRVERRDRAQRGAAERVEPRSPPPARAGPARARRTPAAAPRAARARAASPCSETVSGSARRAHWPIAREPPACAPASRRTAVSSVRRIAIGAARSPLDHGTIHGLWMPAAGEVAEHDRGVDRPVGGLRERARARGARAPARGRDEHERGGQLAHLEQPRHLQQRRGAGQLGERRRAERVAVGHHDDAAAREPGAHPDDRLEPPLAEHGPLGRLSAG